MAAAGGAILRASAGHCHRPRRQPVLETCRAEARVIAWGEALIVHRDAVVERLGNLDEEFFSKELRTWTEQFRRVDRCRYLRVIDGKHLLTYARRVLSKLCPVLPDVGNP